MTYLEAAERALSSHWDCDLPYEQVLPNGMVLSGYTFTWRQQVEYEARSLLTAAGFTPAQMDIPVGSLVVLPTASHMTDEQAEAVCAVVNVCGGIAHTIYDAAIRAARPAEEGAG